MIETKQPLPSVGTGAIEALRIAKLPALPEGSLEELARNPRLSDHLLEDDEAAWPLRVLALKQPLDHAELAARADTLTERIKNEASGSEAEDAFKKIKAAYMFLRWPQNRDRIENVLQNSPGLMEGA